MKVDIGKIIFVVSVLMFTVAGVTTIVQVDRIAWFDEAFSLETARMVQGYALEDESQKQINFHEHDVHPPIYYLKLAEWQSFRPETVTETHWARLLSLIFAIIFLILCYSILRELQFNSFIAGGATFLMSISTTIMHYGTEIRMYMMVVMLCALAVYAAIRYLNRKHIWNLYVAGIAVFFLPLVHYFGIFAGAFLIGLGMMCLPQKKDVKKVFERFKPLVKYLAVILPFYISGSLIAAFMAFDQRSRIANMWFDPSNIGSYPSALLFGFHYTEGFQHEITMVAISILQIILLIILVIGAIWLVKKKEFILQEKVMSAFFLCAFVPLIVIVLSKYVLDLYHHRFVLISLWMFALFVYAMAFKILDNLRKAQKSFLLVIAFIILLLYVVLSHDAYIEYVEQVPRVQENVFAMVPCEGVALHETPFTYVPHVVWDRENNCERDHVLGTLLTYAEGRSSGFDAIGENNIIYFEEEGQYKAIEPTYYFTGYNYYLLIPKEQGDVLYEGKDQYANQVTGDKDWLSVLYVEPNMQNATIEVNIDG